MINLRIIQGFRQYLEDKNVSIKNDKQKYDFDSNSVLSKYSKEFQEYIQENFESDYNFLFSEGFNLDNLKDIKYENGQFVKLDDESENKSADIFVGVLNELSENKSFIDVIDSNFDGNISKDEFNFFVTDLANSDSKIDSETFLNFVSNSYENSSIVDNFFADKNYQTLFDLNGDSVLSDDEILQSKQLLSSLSGDNNGLSGDDVELFKVMFGIDANGSFNQESVAVFKKYINSFKESVGSEESPLLIVKSYIDKLYSNPNFKKENLIDFISGLDGDASNLTSDDILKLTEYAMADILPNEYIEQADVIDSVSSPLGSGVNAPFDPAIKDLNINNMSIEELEAELKNAQKAVNDTLLDLEDTLKVEHQELSERLSETRNNIDKTNEDIMNIDSEISEQQSSLIDAQNNVSVLSSQISSLRKDLASCDDPNQKSKIQSKINSLEEEKRILENETIPKLMQTIQEKEEKKTELNVQLEQYEQELSEIEDEIATLAETNQKIRNKQEAYNEAKKYLESINNMIDIRYADMKKMQETDIPDINEYSKDYSANEEYDFTNLPLTYNFDGKEYHCVGFPEYEINGEKFQINSWEEAQRYLANGGLANIGKFGTMQCHNYSNVLGDIVIGTVNPELLEAMYNETNDPTFGDKDLAGQMGSQSEYNSRDFAQCKAKDRDAERAIIENELQNGRPCLVSVPYVGGTHWVTAIGLSDDGDILIWDSYDGSIKKLGCSSNDDKEKLHRNMATGNGVMVFCNGYSFQYATAKHIDYWEMINNPKYDPLVEGIK